jgi:hypothetical protein
VNFDKKYILKTFNILSITFIILICLLKLIQFHSIPKILFLIFYFLPITIFFVFWVNHKVKEFHKFDKLMVIDSIVVILSALRAINSLAFILPYSGHMLFLSYLAVTIKSQKLRIFIFILLVSTTIFKVIIWKDYFTWINGMILSMPFISLYLLLDKNKIEN